MANDAVDLPDDHRSAAVTRIPITSRLLAEGLGTFGFFFIGFAAFGNGAIGFGVGLMAMIVIFGHISGAHFNPAVTLGLAIGRRFSWSEVPQYWAAQLSGGLLAALLTRGLYGSEVAPQMLTSPGLSEWKALVVEVIATAFLVMVISAVATDSRAPWFGILAPIAIGGYILVAASAFGPISGGSFNPARSLAPAIVAPSWTHLWIYLVGPFVGGAIGGKLFWFVRTQSGDTTT